MEIDRQLDRVKESLRRLGILHTYLGRQDVLTAVHLALEDENRLHMVTKGIYMEVASRCGRKWSSVERNIRTAAKRAWTANPRYLEQLAGYPLNGPPSASELIEILATDAMRHTDTEKTSGPV